MHLCQDNKIEQYELTVTLLGTAWHNNIPCESTFFLNKFLSTLSNLDFQLFWRLLLSFGVELLKQIFITRYNHVKELFTFMPIWSSKNCFQTATLLSCSSSWQSSIILTPIVPIDDACARDHAKQFLLFNMTIPQPLSNPWAAFLFKTSRVHVTSLLLIIFAPTHWA